MSSLNQNNQNEVDILVPEIIGYETTSSGISVPEKYVDNNSSFSKIRSSPMTKGITTALAGIFGGIGAVMANDAENNFDNSPSLDNLVDENGNPTPPQEICCDDLPKNLRRTPNYGVPFGSGGNVVVDLNSGLYLNVPQGTVIDLDTIVDINRGAAEVRKSLFENHGFELDGSKVYAGPDALRTAVKIISRDKETNCLEGVWVPITTDEYLRSLSKEDPVEVIPDSLKNASHEKVIKFIQINNNINNYFLFGDQKARNDTLNNDTLALNDQEKREYGALFGYNYNVFNQGAFSVGVEIPSKNFGKSNYLSLSFLGSFPTETELTGQIDNIFNGRLNRLILEGDSEQYTVQGNLNFNKNFTDNLGMSIGLFTALNYISDGKYRIDNQAMAADGQIYTNTGLDNPLDGKIFWTAGPSARVNAAISPNIDLIVGANYNLFDKLNDESSQLIHRGGFDLKKIDQYNPLAVYFTIRAKGNLTRR